MGTYKETTIQLEESDAELKPYTWLHTVESLPNSWVSILYVVHFLVLSEGSILLNIFSCDQAAVWMVFSVRLSVRLSVRPSVCPSVTPFWLCSHHRIIMKFSGVITKDQGKVHAKGQGQRLKVKVTEVTTQLNRFRTVTPVWVHIWWWNDTYSLMLPYCFSRSSVSFQGHTALKIVEFDPD